MKLWLDQRSNAFNLRPSSPVSSCQVAAPKAWEGDLEMFLILSAIHQTRFQPQGKLKGGIPSHPNEDADDQQGERLMSSKDPLCQSLSDILKWNVPNFPPPDLCAFLATVVPKRCLIVQTKSPAKLHH